MASTEKMLNKALGLGMTESEYDLVLNALGREPTETELAMFSVEWSEHCGYPRSRTHLAGLPRDVGKFKATVGGDAGGIEIEPGLWVVFKMESHNHPSQVEPKQGAATGVGGILRDIFTSGARPIALLDSLRFAELDDPKARYLFNGVVEGIGFYGNCIGVPTVAGEVGFNDCYRTNCLVGAMCIGVLREEEFVTGAASGPNNAVLYIGNSTGRDGIGGCSVLASHEMQEDLEMRPTVQLGDPFTEKCLMEACLEAYKTGAVVAMKDMGAAGLTCTTAEMSAAGGVGMVVDISLVPTREADMAAWEVMMSESQERMLAVAERGREWEVCDIFEKWGVSAVAIGRVTPDKILRIHDGAELVAELDVEKLASPPTYDLPTTRPDYIDLAHAFDTNTLAEPNDLNASLLEILASPNIADKTWVFEQYDHMVGTNTVVEPGRGDAAVLRLKADTRKGLAATADCNSLYCYLDPYVGGKIAVAEAARNLVCVGAEPAGVTDCLCFGNPDKPDRFYQFVECIKGITDACRAFDVPVVSGNVSFYNESDEACIHPSPLIGMVGVLDDINSRATSDFKDTGDTIVLLGLCTNELGGSEYLRVVHGLETGAPPKLTVNLEQAVQRTCLDVIRNGLAKSAHDCSEGGLAVSLAESCIGGSIGAKLFITNECGDKGIRTDALLFGESQSRIVLTVMESQVKDVLKLAQSNGCPANVIGQVGGERLKLQFNEKQALDVSVSKSARVWHNAIPSIMEHN